jgi:hypothetical protein
MLLKERWKKTAAATGRPSGHGKILEIERESITSHCVENSLWKRLWTYRKANYRTNARITQVNRAIVPAA